MSLMIYQAQELEGKKGQGSLEYLLMLGAAIVIVAVVVLAMMGTTNQGTEQNVSAVSGQSSDFSKLLKEVKNPSPIIFLEDAQSTPDSENTFVRVKNDGENAITITTLGTTTSSGTTSIYIPLTITSGNSASFAVPTSGTSCQCTAQETTKTCIFAIRYYSGTTIQTSNIERTITCNPSTGGGYTPPVDTVYPVVIPPTTLLLESAEGSSSSDDVFINLKTEGTDLATIANIRIDQTESTYTPTVTINPGNSINLSVISTGTSCQCTAQDTIKPCTFKINYDIAGTAKSTDFTKDITCNPITSSFNPATITSHDIPPTTLFLESAEGYSTSGKDMLVLKRHNHSIIH
ncbi:MAG: class III signal peptide-containing protein [Candidatus Diapherotrites archaeon]|nr:class III signal peptide-containing protein [Candidatus Diapherotrites archaeon]